MNKHKLGKQGPEISVVGFGAWEAGGDSYGPNDSEDQVIEAIHAGLEAGIDWIDTAEVYGQGHSEELVARAIAGRRDVDAECAALAGALARFDLARCCDGGLLSLQKRSNLPKVRDKRRHGGLARFVVRRSQNRRGMDGRDHVLRERVLDQLSTLLHNREARPEELLGSGCSK